MLTGVVVVISRDRSIDGAIRIFTRGDRAQRFRSMPMVLAYCLSSRADSA